MRVRLTLNELHQFKWLVGGLLTLLSLWSLSGLDLVGSGVNLIMMSALLLPSSETIKFTALWPSAQSAFQ